MTTKHGLQVPEMAAGDVGFRLKTATDLATLDARTPLVSPSAPTSPEDGDLWYDTVAKAWKYWKADTVEWIVFAQGGDVTTHATAATIAHPDASITLAKMAADSVDTTQLVDLAVETGKIADLAVTAAKLAALSIATGSIQDAAVTLAKLAADSVNASKIVDGAVGTAELAAGAVTLAKMASGSVSTSQLVDLAISTAKLADLAVTAAKIANATITPSKLSAGWPGCILARNSNQAIAHSSLIDVIWNQELTDTDSMWAAGSPTEIAVKTAGLWLMELWDVWESNSTGRREARFLLNGTANIKTKTESPSPSSDHAGEMVHVRPLSVNDVIVVQVIQTNSGLGTLQLRGVTSAPFTRIAMELLRPA